METFLKNLFNPSLSRFCINSNVITTSKMPFIEIDLKSTSITLLISHIFQLSSKPLELISLCNKGERTNGSLLSNQYSVIHSPYSLFYDMVDHTPYLLTFR